MRLREQREGRYRPCTVLRRFAQCENRDVAPRSVLQHEARHEDPRRAWIAAADAGLRPEKEDALLAPRPVIRSVEPKNQPPNWCPPLSAPPYRTLTTSRTASARKQPIGIRIGWFKRQRNLCALPGPMNREEPLPSCDMPKIATLIARSRRQIGR